VNSTNKFSMRKPKS